MEEDTAGWAAGRQAWSRPGSPHTCWNTCCGAWPSPGSLWKSVPSSPSPAAGGGWAVSNDLGLPLGFWTPRALRSGWCPDLPSLCWPEGKGVQAWAPLAAELRFRRPRAWQARGETTLAFTPPGPGVLRTGSGQGPQRAPEGLA